MAKTIFDDLEVPRDQVETKRGGSCPTKPGGFGNDTVATGEKFSEPCPKCGGGGQFISWSGRSLGPCFQCKGTGHIAYSQPAPVREKARRDRAQNKTRKLDDLRAAYVAKHPDVLTWLNKHRGSFNFATSLSNALATYGALTEKQTAAVRKCIASDAEHVAKRTAAAPDIDVSRISRAFGRARSAGQKSRKLRIGDFVFRPAPDGGSNPGAIYVTQGNEYLGKVEGGRFWASFTCDEDRKAVIVAAAADPEAAAVAHGLQTGSCSCCGRDLTNKVSVDRGIGPICAAKYGW